MPAFSNPGICTLKKTVVLLLGERFHMPAFNV